MNFDDAIAFAIDTLKADDRFKDVDLSPASATFNMVVLPFAVMSGASWGVVENVQRYLLFANPNQLEAAQLDNIGKMLMAPPRRTDGGVTVDVSLYFKTPSSEPIIITTSDTFTTSGGAVGYPLRDHVLLTKTVGGTPYYVATITVRFEGTGAIPANSVTQTSVIAAGLDYVNNEGPSSQPMATQDNSEYFTVIKNSLSTRNDVNTASIIANYASAYGISDIFATGFGDPEMQRDIAVAARGWSGHIGGRIDAFVRTPMVESSFTTTVDSGGADAHTHTFEFSRYSGLDFNGSMASWQIKDGAPPAAPLVLIDWEKTKVAGRNDFVRKNERGKGYGDIDYKIEVLPDPIDSFWGKNYRYSIYERLRITVDTVDVGTSNVVNLVYKTLAGLEGIQESANAHRLLNCDLLFRSFIPVQVQKMCVVYDENYDIKTGEWAVILADRINSWKSPTGIRFNELFEGIGVPIKFEETGRDTGFLPYKVDEDGEVVDDNLDGDGKVVDDVRAPSYVLLHMDNIDGSHTRYISTRQIYPITTAGLSATYRTCRYFIDPTDITFKAVPSW